MGYMLCPGCEPVPAEPTGTSEPEEDAPDKLKRKIKTLEGNLRDLNTLYFKSLDNYNSMEDWWHKEWHQSQGIPCANDEYCTLTRRVNLPALLSTPSAPATKPAEPGIIGVRGVIEACFPQTDEDTVFERESAIAFIKAIHDRELAKVRANALEEAAEKAGVMASENPYIEKGTEQLCSQWELWNSCPIEIKYFYNNWANWIPPEGRMAFLSQLAQLGRETKEK